MAAPTRQPPLVGREDELKVLEQRLAEATAGEGGLVLISGEAGIGKTSLLDEFGKLAMGKGARVIAGRCLPGGSSPFLPFQDALSRIDSPAKKVLGLKNWLAGSETITNEPWGFGLAAPEMESGRMFYLALDFFRKICRKSPYVVVLDDLHWADSASIQLLHFLARNCRDLKMLIIGSFRPEDVTADQAGKPHPLLESLRAMRREKILQEVSLDRLTTDELRLALEAMLDGKVDTELLKRITKESGGNPLYAVEVMRLLFQTDSIALLDGGWRLTPLAKIDIPPTIREVFVERIERLSRAERRIIESAAVIGESFDPKVLGQVLEIETLVVLDALENIQRTTQLVRAGEGAYVFSHEKVRQVAYDENSSFLRKELHRRVGEALEPGASKETYGELSTHFYHAGDFQKCIRYSVLAGQNALEKFSLREADEYFQRVMRLAKDNPAFSEETLQALEGIADSSIRLGIAHQAMTYYKRFLEHCPPRERGRVLRKLAGCLSDTMEDLSEASRLLEEAERDKGLDPLEIARVKFRRGYVAHVTGALGEAESLYSEAQGRFEKIGSLGDLANVLVQEALLFLSLGRVKYAVDAVENADEMFRSSRDPMGERFAAYCLGVTYFHLGMFQEALSSFAKSEDITSKFGLTLPALHVMRGFLYYSVDNFENAVRDAANGVAECLRVGNPFWLGLGHALLSLCEARIGRIAGAEEAVRRAMQATDSVTSQERFLLRSNLAMAEAEVHAAKGEWAFCNGKFEEAIRRQRSAVYGVLFEALARTRFGEALARQGMTPTAREQFGEALHLYERLGNIPQAERVRKLVTMQ